MNNSFFFNTFTNIQTPPPNKHTEPANCKRISYQTLLKKIRSEKEEIEEMHRKKKIQLMINKLSKMKKKRRIQAFPHEIQAYQREIQQRDSF